MAKGNRQWEILNTFAYTCGFSVCAAKAGARTTSLDLSKRSLDWGKRNFALNQLDPAGHEFLYGDALDWLRRLAKKQRLYDVVLLDPPTFSTGKKGRAFQAGRDYAELAAQAIKKGTGARALRSLLERLMLDIMYEAPSSDDILHVQITPPEVAGQIKPIIRRKPSRAAA